MSLVMKEWEARIELIRSIARSQQAMARILDSVADIAEREGHHPDIAIHWNKVDLVLWTHKIGGLHENDFILAAKINRLLEEGADASAG